jgi:hypothetical protein
MIDQAIGIYILSSEHGHYIDLRAHTGLLTHSICHQFYTSLNGRLPIDLLGSAMHIIDVGVARCRISKWWNIDTYVLRL